MTLDEWLAREGTGARQQLHFDTKCSLPAIDRAREGKASKETAEKISAATGGKVRAASMYPADEQPPLPRKRRRAARA